MPKRASSSETLRLSMNVSSVILGPLQPKEMDANWRMQGWSATIDPDLGPVAYEVFAVNTANAPLTEPIVHGMLLPGVNRFRDPVTSRYLYIKLTSSGPLSWAYESMFLEGLVPVGRTDLGV